MSFPTIPDITPSITVTSAEVVNLLLASIAFEELSLAHIMNAEAEKIQAVLGTLEEGIELTPTPTFGDLLAVDSSVERVLRTVIKKEMLLQFKLEEILDNLEPILAIGGTTSTPPV